MEKPEERVVRKAHILVLALPYQGHINPIMQFSKRLASKGVGVTVMASSTTSTTNLHTIKNKANTSINIEYMSFGAHQPKNHEENMAHVQDWVLKKVPELIEKQKKCGEPIEAIVYDSLMPWAMDLGHQFGLRVASFFVQCSTSSAIYYLVYQGKIKFPVEEGSSLSFLPFSIPNMEVKDLPLELYPGISDLLAGQFANVHKVDWIFFNSFLQLEYEVLKWLSSQLKIMIIGPSIPSMYLDKRITDDSDYALNLFKPDGEAACIKWLDSKDTNSVVYVSTGSLADLKQDDMNELARGLLNSKHNFLWIVRDSEKSKLPENFMEEAGEKGLVVNWCNQLQVLSHKAVGSFLTHCGWNSALEAISLGMPMLVMPHCSDQTTIAKYAVDVWKTGIRVKPHEKERVTSDEIVNCIRDVMEETKIREEVRANALKWKEMALAAMTEGGISDNNINQFISDLLSSSTTTVAAATT